MSDDDDRVVDVSGDLPPQRQRNPLWLLHVPVLIALLVVVDTTWPAKVLLVVIYLGLFVGRPMLVVIYDRIAYLPDADNVLFRGAAKLWTGEADDEWIWKNEPQTVLERTSLAGELRATRTEFRWIPGAAARAKGARALIIPVSSIEGCALSNERMGGIGEAFVEIAGDDWGIGFEVASAHRLGKTLDRLFDGVEVDVDLTDGQARPRWLDTNRVMPPQVKQASGYVLAGAWFVLLLVLLSLGEGSSSGSQFVDLAQNVGLLGTIAAALTLITRPTSGIRISLAASVFGIFVALVSLPAGAGHATVDAVGYGALLLASLYVHGHREGTSAP